MEKEKHNKKLTFKPVNFDSYDLIDHLDQNGFFIENDYSDREIDVFSSILGVYIKYDSSHKIKRNQWKKIEY